MPFISTSLGARAMSQNQPTEDPVGARPSKKDLFVGAYNDIHEALKRKAGLTGQVTFPVAFAKAAEKERWLRRFEKQLDVLRIARNNVEHEVLDGLPVTEPTDWAASRIRALRSSILYPSSIEEFTHGVECGDAFTSVSDVIRLMYEKSYSQIPIKCDDGRYRLLTTNTVTRWVAASVVKPLDLDTCVGDVLPFSEEGLTAVFVGRRANIFQVLQEFESNPGLTAVLITDSGRDTETPLGIVTVWDLPGLRLETRDDQ